MKPEFRTELTHTQRIVVDRDRTIGFMGEAMRVYSTPSMVLDVERTCKDFLAQYLTPEQNSVGMTAKESAPLLPLRPERRHRGAPDDEITASRSFL